MVACLGMGRDLPIRPPLCSAAKHFSSRMCFTHNENWRVKPQGIIDVFTGGDKDRKRKIGLVAIPAASDLVATALATIGIIYIPASVWQMLRGKTSSPSGANVHVFPIRFAKENRNRLNPRRQVPEGPRCAGQFFRR